MTTSKTAWAALSVANWGLWLAAIVVGVLFAIYRGRHPESWHAIFTACILLVFFGSPVLALLSTSVIAAARSHGEVVPPMATRSRDAVWGMVIAVALFVIGELAWIIVQVP